MRDPVSNKKVAGVWHPRLSAGFSICTHAGGASSHTNVYPHTFLKAVSNAKVPLTSHLDCHLRHPMLPYPQPPTMFLPKSLSVTPTRDSLGTEVHFQVVNPVFPIQIDSRSSEWARTRLHFSFEFPSVVHVQEESK